MGINIETVAPLELCSVGLVSQLCGLPKYTNYALGYQFKHVKEVIGDSVIKQLADHNITLGTKFGGAGVDPRILLTNEPDDSYYEICARQLLELPWPKHKIAKLLNKHKLIIRDFVEGGFFITRVLNELAEEVAQARDIIYAYAVATHNTGNWNLDSIPANKRLEIPMVIYGVGTYYQKSNLVTTGTKPTNKFLVPVHKARHWRVEALSILEEKGILQDADWSLHHINKDQVTRINSFTGSPNLRNRLHDNDVETATVDQFINKHKHELPKGLPYDDAVIFSDHMNLNSNWQEYEWYIGIETHNDKFLITEKCLKGFALGIPSIVISGKDFNNYLSTFGFKMDGDYDHASTLIERVKLACEFIKNNKGNKDIAKHNHDLLNDNDFLASLIVKPLVELLGV